MNQSSTRWRAQGVLRRNVRLDFTERLNWKQRMGIRRPISPQPCRWTSWLRIFSGVMPCNASRGWETGDVMGSEFPFLAKPCQQFFCRFIVRILGEELAGEGADEKRHPLLPEHGAPRNQRKLRLASVRSSIHQSYKAQPNPRRRSRTLLAAMQWKSGKKNQDAAKSTFGTSRTDGGTLKKSPSDLKPNRFATRLLGNVSHLFR